MQGLGQTITFAVDSGEDDRIGGWLWINVKVGDTVAIIAARRGHPESANRIADANKIRSNTQVLLHKPRKPNDRVGIMVPGKLRNNLSFSALAGDDPPTITAGYAKLSIVDRPQLTGLTRHDGFDPMGLDVPIRFVNIGIDGEEIESRIAQLEQMAGRGQFSGSGSGEASIITVTTTDDDGKPVPLIPLWLQRTADNPQGPLWRIGGIDWDQQIRNRAGRRIRVTMTVKLQQHVTASAFDRSTAKRFRDRRLTRAQRVQAGATALGGVAGGSA